jgi:DNA-binding NarL/FixJ family response regulator
MSTRTELTDRELQVLELLADGLCNKEVAGKLFITIKTVEKHRQSVYRKLGVNHLLECVRRALRAGIIDQARWLRCPDKSAIDAGGISS